MEIEQEEITLHEYSHDGGVNRYKGSLTLEVYARIHDCSPIVTDNQRIAHYLRNNKSFEACGVTLIEENEEALSHETNRLLTEMYGVTEVIVIRLSRE